MSGAIGQVIDGRIEHINLFLAPIEAITLDRCSIWLCLDLLCALYCRSCSPSRSFAQRAGADGQFPTTGIAETRTFTPCAAATQILSPRWWHSGIWIAAITFSAS